MSLRIMNKRNDEDEEKKMMLPKIYTIEEAANILNVKITKLRKAVFRKEISYIKFGALVRFREQDIHNYIHQNVIQHR